MFHHHDHIANLDYVTKLGNSLISTHMYHGIADMFHLSSHLRFDLNNSMWPFWTQKKNLVQKNFYSNHNEKQKHFMKTWKK